MTAQFPDAVLGTDAYWLGGVCTNGDCRDVPLSLLLLRRRQRATEEARRLCELTR